jgi:2-polyprenyl-3-methyl-5-hydroxy-6-metoxy-1,4-benzoquinol methylase
MKHQDQLSGLVPVAESDKIRSTPQTHCHLCGAAGKVLYEGLTDRLFGAPGAWNFKMCSNEACELVWLDPMPRAEEMPKLYSEYLTHTPEGNAGPAVRLYNAVRNGILAVAFGYEKVGAKENRRLFYRVLSKVRDLKERMGGEVMWLDASLRGRLLDVGCGNGEFIAHMRDLGWQVVGLEPDADAVLAATGTLGLDVRQGSLEDTDFPAASFDAITMNHVVEHLPEPEETLRRCLGLLRPGGLLVMVTPNAYSLGHAKFGMDWRGLEPPRHFYLYNPKSIRALVTRAGFAVRSLRTTAKGAMYLLALSRMARRTRLSGKAGDFGTLMRSARRRPFMCAFSQLAESIALSFSSVKGEELVIVAERPS